MESKLVLTGGIKTLCINNNHNKYLLSPVKIVLELSALPFPLHKYFYFHLSWEGKSNEEILEFP